MSLQGTHFQENFMSSDVCVAVRRCREGWYYNVLPGRPTPTHAMNNRMRARPMDRGQEYDTIAYSTHTG